MKDYNIYMSGVGGQGIGLLSELLMRAADYAGYSVKAVDTHGLAQRGGVVVSQLRIGKTVYTPLIPAHGAHLVVCLERHEALRALDLMCAGNTTLVYYDTAWQPLAVRLGHARQVGADDVEQRCARLGVRLVRVYKPGLKDARMQNMVVVSRISRQALIDGITAEHYRMAMDDLMAGSMLEENRALFDSEAADAAPHVV